MANLTLLPFDSAKSTIMMFSEIATKMDSVRPAKSLRELFDMHRLIPGETISYRKIHDRHNSSQSKECSFMMLNTYLMDMKITKAMEGPGLGALITIATALGFSLGGALLGAIVGALGLGSIPIFRRLKRGTRKVLVNVRAVEIGQYINDNIDLAALSEVWTSDEQTPLLAQIEDLVAYANKHGGLDRFVNNNSGLLTISKALEIETKNFQEFSHESGHDRRADKGVLMTEFSLGYMSSKLLLYNTHLQAGNRKLALVQLLQLVDFVSRTKSEHDVAIIAGDFNLSAESEIGDNCRIIHYDVDEIISLAEEKFEVSTHLKANLRLENRREAYDIVKLALESIDFYDFWEARNGSRGITTSACGAKAIHCICTEDTNDDKFCSDIDSPTNSMKGERIDYIFVSRPHQSNEFYLDLTRPRRLNLDRPNGASGKYDEGGIRFMSDHLGLFTKLIISPREL